jgi:hypothetical protein
MDAVADKKPPTLPWKVKLLVGVVILGAVYGVILSFVYWIEHERLKGSPAGLEAMAGGLAAALFLWGTWVIVNLSLTLFRWRRWWHLLACCLLADAAVLAVLYSLVAVFT